MPEATPQVLKAASLRDLVALVPFQCGFHPQHSLVVLSLRGPRSRIGQVTRVDLPPPDDVPDLAAHIASFVARDQGQASVVLVYDEQPWDPGDPPHLRLVTMLLAELERAGVPARDAAYISPERYWSYLCRTPGCCPGDGGSVTAAMSSPVAAALVLAGLAPRPSREDIVEQVHPSDPQLVSAVVASAWRRLEARQETDAGPGPGSPPGSEPRSSHEAVSLVEELLPAFRDGVGSLEVDQAARLVAALQSVAVRDDLLLRYCRVGLALVTSSHDGPAALPSGLPGLEPAAPVDPSSEEAMERLLVALCRQVDGPLAAAPLVLLAWHAWARREGALARVAVERALGEDPAYRLAGLLAAALDHGVAPDWVGEARRADAATG